jgi:tetratricopeptide (TPR) repeat protein
MFIFFIFTASLAQAKSNSSIDSYNKGVEAASNGDFKQATALFKKSVKENSIFIPPLQMLHIAEDVIMKKLKASTAKRIFSGVKLTNQRATDKAIKEFDIAIKAAPKYSNTYTLRAMARSLANDIEGATADLTKAMKLDPKNFIPYYMRGTMYASRGIFTHALSDLDKAIELNPKIVATYNNRAGVYFKKGELDMAITDLSSAIELAPKNAMLYQSRGFIYTIRLSDNTKGCADWKTACDLGNCESLKIAKEANVCE